MDQSEKQIDSLSTLILKHDLLIRTWQGRLDDMNARELTRGDGDTPRDIVRCQLEMMILQAECIMADKENQRDGLMEQQKWLAERADSAPTGDFRPAPAKPGTSLDSLLLQLSHVSHVSLNANAPADTPQWAQLPLTRFEIHKNVDLNTVRRTVMFVNPQHPGVGRMLLEVRSNGETFLLDPITGAAPKWENGESIAEEQWRKYLSVQGVADLLPLAAYPDCMLEDGALPSTPVRP